METAIEALQADIDKKIEAHGFTVLWVGASLEEQTPPFAYTIGVQDKWGVELLIEAVPIHIAQHFLNEVVAAARKLKWDLSKPCLLRGFAAHNLEMVLLPADDKVKGSHTLQVEHYYGHKGYKVMQLVIPDPHNRFPWHDDYDAELMRKAPCYAPHPENQGRDLPILSNPDDE